MRLFRFCVFFTFITGLNTSEEEPDPSHIPGSASDVSPLSRDVWSGPTRLAEVFRVGIAHTLGTEIPGQGGEFSGSGDKTRLRTVPQESRHNGQEKAGRVFSALAHTAVTDSQVHSSLSASGTQWPGRFTWTPDTATGTDSNTLSEHATRMTKITPYTHTDTETLPDDGGHVTVMSSDPTHLTTFVNTASLSGLDSSVTSSPPTANDAPDRSGGTSRTDRVSFRLIESVPYASVTEKADDDVMMSPANADSIPTNHFPRTAHATENASDPTALFTTSPLSRPIHTSPLSHFHSDVSDHVTSVTQNRAESQSDAAASQTSRSTAAEFTTDHQQTSNVSSRATSAPAARLHDFTSYSPITPGQGDHVTSTTLRSGFFPSTVSENDLITTRRDVITSPAESQPTQTQTDHKTAITSGSHATTPSPDSSLVTFTPFTPPVSGGEAPSPAPSQSLTSAQTSLLQTTTRILNRLATDANHQPRPTPPASANAPSRPGTRAPPSLSVTPTSSHHTLTAKPDPSHRGRIFITEDQPAIITAETFPVLLQVILERNASSYAGLVEVEPFLQTVAGFQNHHVTWNSGAVVQSVVTFRTEKAVSWLGRAESLLQEAGLRPLPARGVFVSGVRVKNITVGGLHTDVCFWLFSCPPDFYCVSSEGNITCRSVCHSDYCKNQGICVHHPAHRPLCQCPVGEDFWFMGQRCDLRMTRQRLAGVCVGVLAAIAALMGLLAFLAVQRFKKMLIQAKAEQTQSSYRRFNHFDELSARFWRRSWPGSEDSLDNTAFSRSDELLHMRALDRACCYHDDTLSIASTFPDSITRLNTVYPHSCQYQWDMSTCSLADGVIDSGKASDLSVCSWPIEPIQWTPFPLLQQLRNSNTMKPSRPRSYCEGMELVGLEKSRTA